MYQAPLRKCTPLTSWIADTPYYSLTFSTIHLLSAHGQLQPHWVKGKTQTALTIAFLHRALGANFNLCGTKLSLYTDHRGSKQRLCCRYYLRMCLPDMTSRLVAILLAYRIEQELVITLRYVHFENTTAPPHLYLRHHN